MQVEVNFGISAVWTSSIEGYRRDGVFTTDRGLGRDGHRERTYVFLRGQNSLVKLAFFIIYTSIMVNGAKRPSSQRRHRSTVGSSSSENNSPASKCSTITRFMASTPSTTTEERTKDTLSASANPPQSPANMWAILVDIQSKLGQILAENVILRKEVEESKNAQQESNQQIDTLSSKVVQITSQMNSMEKKINDQQSYIKQLEENVKDLVVEKDALEQYTRKYNVEVHGVPECSGKNLSELIPSIANKLGSSITSESINIVYCVFITSPGAKPIIVRF